MKRDKKRSLVQEEIRAVLKAAPGGDYVESIARKAGLSTSATYNALTRMCDTWIDSWEIRGQGRPRARWRVVPENCPPPKATRKQMKRKHLKDAEIISAVEQACREASFAFSGLMRHVTSDDGAVVHHGGSTPRIACILSANEQSVRRRLTTMSKKGLMKRHQGRGGGVIYWWPVGLFDRISAGKEVSQPAN